ncbi:hypothetical protein [Roseibium aggregatum]|uniref:Surface antigen domain-containing protein n=1 Tax=Roseibium aggregatum TaxID=187304 RepID=A0A939EJ31_9HYPH|nr:hypothetical protein [Roseibium aggregatum]MBN9673223.1 hypothetical protein [Roseibium aggregatum]
MTFDEKREQILLASEIGRILDGEGSPKERAELLETLRGEQDANRMLQQLAHDNRLVQQAIPAPVPQESLDRFEAVIGREFTRRNAPPVRSQHPVWTGYFAQAAAALFLVAGTFMFTSFWMESRMDSAVASLAARLETDRFLIAQTVQEALETKVSGDPIYISHEGDWTETFTPVQTYKSKSGHWCRQYVRESTFSGLDMTIRGTACRDQNGTWTTVFAEPVTGDFSSETPGI